MISGSNVTICYTIYVFACFTELNAGGGGLLKYDLGRDVPLRLEK